MKIFSWFSPPPENVEGSYCDTSSKSDVDYITDDTIEEETGRAEERGDEIIYDDDDFHNEAVSERFDDDCKPVKQGPQFPRFW